MDTSAEDRFCYRCGAPLLPGASFCHKCGQALQKPTQASAIPPLAPNPVAGQMMSPPRLPATRRNVLIVIAGIVAVTVGGSWFAVSRLRTRGQGPSALPSASVLPVSSTSQGRLTNISTYLLQFNSSWMQYQSISRMPMVNANQVRQATAVFFSLPYPVECEHLRDLYAELVTNHIDALEKIDRLGGRGATPNTVAENIGAILQESDNRNLELTQQIEEERASLAREAGN